MTVGLPWMLPSALNFDQVADDAFVPDAPPSLEERLMKGVGGRGPAAGRRPQRRWYHTLGDVLQGVADSGAFSPNDPDDIVASIGTGLSAMSGVRSQFREISDREAAEGMLMEDRRREVEGENLERKLESELGGARTGLARAQAADLEARAPMYEAQTDYYTAGAEERRARATELGEPEAIEPGATVDARPVVAALRMAGADDIADALERSAGYPNVPPELLDDIPIDALIREHLERTRPEEEDEFDPRTDPASLAERSAAGVVARELQEGIIGEGEEDERLSYWRRAFNPEYVRDSLARAQTPLPVQDVAGGTRNKIDDVMRALTGGIDAVPAPRGQQDQLDEDEIETVLGYIEGKTDAEAREFLGGTYTPEQIEQVIRARGR